MKKQFLIVGLSLFAVLSNAQANDVCNSEKSQYWDNCEEAISATSASTLFPFVTSSNITTYGNAKLIVAAKEDAQAFVATNGEIYGVRLSSAIETLRNTNAQLEQVSDMEIAQAILAY
jgi:conserverd hypothetical protein